MLAVGLILACLASATIAATPTAHAGRSITDTSASLPAWSEVLRVISLRDHNTRVVIQGVTVLGLAAGIIGTFLLLRRRALMGDAISHATLPGIGIAFLVMTAYGGTGKWLPGLLLGALIAGIVGVGMILAIRHLTRLKEDAALGIVLSVFFGLGVAILGIVQKTQTGHAAGLESFIFGKTASMLTADAALIRWSALGVTAVCVLFFKEFSVLCFDQEYARVQGWPVLLLDAVMMTLVVAVTVIGLQAVGLILVIALLVIPPAAARFWTHHLPIMVAVSAGIGALSGLIGAAASALIPRLPAGAIIVVVAATLFAFSMIFGPARGILVRAIRHVALSRRVARQHLLRAAYEAFESRERETIPAADQRKSTNRISFDELLRRRSWSPNRLRRVLASAERDGLAFRDAERNCVLTETGLEEARNVVRNHRLWELYLITHADIAPGHVDRDADQLEHVLGPAMVRKLEAMLAAEDRRTTVPPSPHELVPGGATGST
jgi:manganese/zinc/iron transport system permease protein